MVRALLCALVLFYFQRFAHGARIRSTGHQASMGRMGYLTRDEASGGTLYFQWAEEGSETGALASVVPGPNVKKWELNAKKKEIARGVRNDVDWFQGWVEFLSLARKKGTTVTLLQKEVQIVLLYPNDEVSIVEVDKGFNIQEVSVVSVLGVLATSFNGVKKMSKNSFVSQAPSGAKGRVLALPGTTVARTGGGTTTSEDPDEAPEEKPVEPAESAEVGAGAYLVFSPEDSGTMFLQWHKTRIPDALAYFSTTKVSLTNFRYKGEGKKDKLKAKLGVNKKEYYRAWISFLRQAWKMDGVFQLLNAGGVKPTQVAVIETAQTGTNHKVHVAKQGVPINFKGMEACAVVHRDSKAFQVGGMGLNTFLGSGNSEGASSTFKS